MKVVWIFFSFFCMSYGALTGQWKKLNVTDPQTLAYASASIEELDKSGNSLCPCLIELKEAEVQVVAGLKYRFKFVKGESNCLADKKIRLNDCKENKNKLVECTVDLWVQPWMKTQQITSSDCQPVVSENPTKPRLGGDDHDIGGYGAFANFKAKYNKQYSDDEEEVRFAIFQENMKKAQELNKYELGTATYGASQLADLSVEEFKKYYTSGPWKVENDPSLMEAEIPYATPPDAWDWRDHNAVSEIKNQGSCGSCWAFSVTGNVEGQWAIKKGNLTSLSEQELVDCDKLDDGCNGGLPTNAYKEIIRLGGLETETEYPYEGKDDKCVFKKADARVKINGALNISRDEDDMKAWLYKNGPISIGINAMAMQFYLGGISHPWSIFCSPDVLDHGVLIVGYGVKNGWFGKTPYWIIKNSWGPSWGEKGYYLLYRGGGVCGVNVMPTSAVVN